MRGRMSPPHPILRLPSFQVSESATASRLAGAEEAVRRAEGELAAGRVRAAQLEAALRAKEAAADKLGRALDAARREEADAGLAVGGFGASGCEGFWVVCSALVLGLPSPPLLLNSWLAAWPIQ
jgi:hypothetical protein